MPSKIDEWTPGTGNNASGDGLATSYEFFEVQDYQPGAMVGKQDKRQLENLTILAEGNIKIKVQNCTGEATIQMLRPGDILYPEKYESLRNANNDLESPSKVKLYAVGKTKILSIDISKVEGLVKFQQEHIYNLIRDTIRSGQGILQKLNCQFAELRNYIYGVNGRY